MSNVDNILGSTGFYAQNPYTKFQGGMPMPGYIGTPTDAMGNPIQPPPGTTLNSTPAQTQSPGKTGAATLQDLYGSAPGASAINPSGNGALLAANWGAFMGPSGMMNQDAALRGIPSGGNALMNPGSFATFGGSGSQSPAASGAAPIPSGGQVATPGAVPPGAGKPGDDLSASGGTYGLNSLALGQNPQGWSGTAGQGNLNMNNPNMQNALSLLSNPGHVTTPGSDIPSAAAPGGSDTLTQFLGSQGGQSGAGGYSNKGFFDTLNALKAGGAPTQSTSLTPNVGGSISGAFAPVMKPGGLGGLGGM